MKAAPRTVFNVYLAREHKLQIRRLALERGCTASALVREAIEQWLSREGGKVEANVTVGGEEREHGNG